MPSLEGGCAESASTYEKQVEELLMRLRLGTINMSFNLQAGGLYRLKPRSQGNILVISGI